MYFVLSPNIISSWWALGHHFPQCGWLNAAKSNGHLDFFVSFILDQIWFDNEKIWNSLVIFITFTIFSPFDNNLIFSLFESSSNISISFLLVKLSILAVVHYTSDVGSIFDWNICAKAIDGAHRSKGVLTHAAFFASHLGWFIYVAHINGEQKHQFF